MSYKVISVQFPFISAFIREESSWKAPGVNVEGLYCEDRILLLLVYRWPRSDLVVVSTSQINTVSKCALKMINYGISFLVAHAFCLRPVSHIVSFYNIWVCDCNKLSQWQRFCCVAELWLYTENEAISRMLYWEFPLMMAINYVKSNLHDGWDAIYIQIVINLHITESKPHTVAINCLNHLELVRLTEYKGAEIF